MNDLDGQMRDALQAEQDELTDDDDWQVHYDAMRAMFRGQQRLLTIVNLSLIGLFTTMMIISASQFFRVESQRAMIAWATGFAVSILLEAILEVWFYMEWNKCVLRREIKQLELQVASLANHLRGDS